MRHLATALVVLIALGCKGKDTNDDRAPPEPSPQTSMPFARIDRAEAVVPLAKLPRPRRIVWIAATGALEVAESPTPWNGTLPATHAPAANADALDAPDAPRTRAPTDPWAAPPAGIGDDDRSFDRALAARGDTNAHEDAMLFLAAPAAPALTLVRLLTRFGGSIGVMRGTELSALRVGYRNAVVSNDLEGTRRPWLELHLDADGVHAISLPTNGQSNVPWLKGSLDLAGLRAMYQGFGKEPPLVDVFVTAAVSQQRLVDVLGALDQLGVTKLGLGESRGPVADRHAQMVADRIARSSYRTATAWLTIGRPYSQGDLEKFEIVRVVREHMVELMTCYEPALAKAPKLRGTVSTQFYIDPSGRVTTATGSGVDQTVATCMADKLKTFPFPKARGGGSVQVNFPISLGPMEL